MTDAGEAALRSEYADYRRIFEAEASLTLEGRVTSGMGEGRHYISLSGYMVQFRERLAYEPFAGTLNVELTEESVRARAGMTSLDGIQIDGWEDDERTFGPATCYAATLSADDESFDTAHIIVPDRTHHDEEKETANPTQEVLHQGHNRYVVRLLHSRWAGRKPRRRCQPGQLYFFFLCL